MTYATETPEAAAIRRSTIKDRKIMRRLEAGEHIATLAALQRFRDFVLAGPYGEVLLRDWHALPAHEA